MSELLRRRTAARGWVTRTKKALAAVLRESEPDYATLVDAVADFDNRLGSLDDIQSDYELQCERIEEEIEDAADFREEARKVLC